MTALVVGSPEWIAERRTGLFGTDLPKILGVSRFGGSMDVFMDKMALTAPLVETPAMKWGRLLEEPVAREYAITSGRKVRRAAGMLRHPAYKFLGANIDRWSDKPGTPRRVLEVKTSGEFSAKEFGQPGTDQVPPDYLVQTMHYLSVTGKDTADLAVLIGGQKDHTYTIERDDDLIREMIEVATKFWSDTQQGIPPDIDGSEGSALFLAHKFADTGVELPMTDDLAMLATAYAALKSDVKAREAEIALTGNQIRALMGDARWAEGSGVRVVYSERKGATTVRWAEMVATLPVPPTLIEEFSSTGDPTRSLTVTMKGDV